MTKKLALLLSINIALFGCNKDSTSSTSKELPKITTSSTTNITSTSATSGGTIISNGNDSITAFGICWANTQNPTTANFYSVDTSNSTFFTHNLNGLTRSKTYYVRAYATNSVGTAYGNQITFRTDSIEHVYIAGNSEGRCVYWKDGVLIPITNTGTFNFSEVYSITVANNDVYVAGFENNGSGFNEAKIWKNAVGATLASLNSSAQAISVVNNDVYVAGVEASYSNYVIKVWKNGTPTTLSNPNNTADARSIFVVNNDVYVGGYEYTGVTNTATIWKNGVPTRLYRFVPPYANEWSNVTSIYVVGNDVYAVGTARGDNVIWKNEVATPINISPTSIFVVNNDIYIAGTVGNVASIWKNGVTTSLTNGMNQAFANSVFVKDNDVYVVGSERQTGTINSIAKVWKNGVLTNLTNGNGTAEANAIFVQ